MGTVYLSAEPRYYYEKVQQPSQVFNLQIAGITDIRYLDESAGTADVGTPDPDWYIEAPPPLELEVATDGLLLHTGNSTRLLFARDGVVFSGWNVGTGAATQVGTATSGGVIRLGATPLGNREQNLFTWSNLAHNRAGAQDVLAGIFRVNVAPLKAGSFQIQDGPRIGNANSGGDISGDFIGRVDFQRGIVMWAVAGVGSGDAEGEPATASQLTYNAVYLSYVPLDKNLLGVNPVRLPLDGKVPIFRAGGPAVVHHTGATVLPNPLTKGTHYSLGRARVAVLPRVVDATGAVVSATLYDADLDAGEFWILTGADLTGLVEPISVQHRIEDILQVSEADISGRIKFTRALTHNFPAGTYVSSAVAKGDLFARAENYYEQTTWTGVWADALIGTAPTAQFNDNLYPVVTTNRGAIDSRWAIIFLTSSTYRVVGESVGEVAQGNINETLTVANPGRGVPYMVIDYRAFGGGWAQGNVVRFDTRTCGAPFWVAKATLQGPNTLQADVFELSWRGNVNSDPV